MRRVPSSIFIPAMRSGFPWSITAMVGTQYNSRELQRCHVPREDGAEEKASAAKGSNRRDARNITSFRYANAAFKDKRRVKVCSLLAKR